jgi:hypothetical protein
LVACHEKKIRYLFSRRKEYQDGNFKVTLGGDQQVRVNMDSAKMLRAGTHSPAERLQQFSPIVIEFFHVQQDLLEKIFKTFYVNNSSRYEGTLSNLKAELHRTNVNCAVKSNSAYKPHKDFGLLINS